MQAYDSVCRAVLVWIRATGAGTQRPGYPQYSIFPESTLSLLENSTEFLPLQELRTLLGSKLMLNCPLSHQFTSDTEFTKYYKSLHS